MSYSLLSFVGFTIFICPLCWYTGSASPWRYILMLGVRGYGCILFWSSFVKSYWQCSAWISMFSLLIFSRWWIHACYIPGLGKSPEGMLYFLPCIVFLGLWSRYGLLTYLVWIHRLRVVLAQNDSMCMSVALFERKKFMVTIHLRSYLSKYTCILIFCCAIVLLSLKTFLGYVIGCLDKIQAIIRMMSLVRLIFYWYNSSTIYKHLAGSCIFFFLSFCCWVEKLIWTPFLA